MAKSEVSQIVLMMIISAALTLAVEYWPRKPANQTRLTSVAPFSATPAAPAAAREGAAIPAQRTAPAALALAAVGRSEPSAAPAAEAENSTEIGQPAEPLPVAFHIRNRKDLHLIDGTITNISSKTLALTLRTINPATQAASEISFQLAPGERKTYSTDDGLYMQSNDQLIVQSPPYQDRVVQVP